MKLQTHYIIAKIAAENAGLTKAKRIIFCIGALIPDVTLMQFVHPHFYSRSGKYIIEKIKRLSGRTSIYALLEFGKTAHYISDFCCSAHFGGGIGNVCEHILYERNLNIYAAENYSELKDECSLYHDEKTPENILKEYFQEEKFNFHTDFIAAVRACMSVCELVAAEKKSFKKKNSKTGIVKGVRLAGAGVRLASAGRVRPRFSAGEVSYRRQKIQTKNIKINLQNRDCQGRICP